MVIANRKKALHKDFWMEIRKNKARFISIFCIVALGVAFFSGIQATSPDMRYSGDAYYTESKLMDLKVVGTLGLTDEDVFALEEIKGVELAEGAYSTDVISTEEDSQKVLHVESLNENVNQLMVSEGKLPENSGECFLDSSYAETLGYQVGDALTFTEDGDSELLKKHTYTIVGIGTSPLYISFNRGNTTIGSGEINGFAYILPDDFDSEVYTQIYIRAHGVEKVTSYTDAYDTLIEKVQTKVEGIEKERCQIRYDNIISDAEEEIADAEKELEDGKKESDEELADAKKELEDGEKELEDGQKEYDDGLAQIEDAKKELEDGKTQIASAKEELQSGRSQIASAKAELEDGRAQLEAAKETLASSRAELEAGEEQLNDGWAQYNSAKSELDSSEAELTAGKTQVQQGLETVNSTISTLNTQIPQLESAIAAIDLDSASAAVSQAESAVSAAQSAYDTAVAEGAENQEELLAALEVAQSAYAEAQTAYGTAEASKSSLEGNLNEAKAGLAAAQATQTELNQKLATIEAGAQELASGKATLEEQYQLLVEKQAELDSGKAQLEAGESEIAANEQTIASGEAQIASSQAQIDSGAAEIAANEQKILEGEKEIAENEKKLADAQKELEDGKKELKDGWKEYNDGKKEAEEKIADAQKEIDDAKEDLADIDEPEWIITDRNDLPEYSDYGDNADRIKNIGKVFPVIFFLVAALISLTTMTRMVEEQRTQIGTLKALGYNKLSIASKYLSYALLATVGGSVTGVLIGEKILPFIIITAYGIMYHNVGSDLQIHYELVYALMASFAAILCTVGATIFSCARTLSETPASLMRPPAPKEGKRIFLERIPFIWKYLNFTWKSSMRNLFRYKKRLLMTVFGIAGSMGLMLVGYGVQDSITDIVRLQYADLQHYDGTIVTDEDASQEELDELEDSLAENDKLERYTSIQLTKVSAPNGKSNLSIYLYVPEDLDNFKEDVTLRNRVTHEEYELTDEGAVIGEKTASLIGLEVGDMMTLERDNTEYEVKVAEITENYAGHYVYLTPTVYEETFGEKPEYEDIVFTIKPEYEDDAERIGQEIMESDAVLSISYTSSIVDQVERMLSTLGIVIVVLIVSAGLLAFVVLYNLNNINITERQRELATLKVLGFYDLEVSQYVLRENIILTILGIVIGAFFGIFLHRYIIVTVEVDAVMFGRNIRAISFVYCALLTAMFSIIVNLFMHQKLKKIDMVESLKSVE